MIVNVVCGAIHLPACDPRQSGSLTAASRNRSSSSLLLLLFCCCCCCCFAAAAAVAVAVDRFTVVVAAIGDPEFCCGTEL